MTHSIWNDPKDSAATIIPFKQTGTRVARNCDADSETDALLVRTDKIFFFATMYRDSRRHYGARGYIVFATNAPMYFTTSVEKTSAVHDRCVAAARRIARIYGGIVEEGKLDCYGMFRIAPQESGFEIDANPH